ncbi:MAG: 3-hydroxyacyl-CoA dehydrogenase family protein [Lautropia sp.]|nr:3-hydroxyacyl-CoA dehydrogenase family protein [Lautropia sp.]
MTTKQHRHACHASPNTTHGSGLAVERIRHAWFNEALALLGEGMAAETIEAMALKAGFVDGPLAMLDIEGLARTDELYHQWLASQGKGCGHDHHHGHHHDHQHGEPACVAGGNDSAHHAHSHACGHGHRHGHGHGHSHHDEKQTDGGQGCCHHGHKHQHGHGHRHDEHGLSQGCQHGQDHAHDCRHGQVPDHHDHSHDHDHGHDHHHGHGNDSDANVSWFRLTEEGAYVMEKMAHGLQRMGRAAGGGFYDYDDEDDEHSDRELWSGLKAFVRRGVDLPDSDVMDRLRFAPIIELLRLLTSQKASPAAPRADAADRTRDIVTASGLWPAGYEPLAGVAKQGVEAFAERAAALEAAHGERFALPQGWRTLVA